MEHRFMVTPHGFAMCVDCGLVEDDRHKHGPCEPRTMQSDPEEVRKSLRFVIRRMAHRRELDAG